MLWVLCGTMPVEVKLILGDKTESYLTKDKE